MEIINVNEFRRMHVILCSLHMTNTDYIWCLRKMKIKQYRFDTTFEEKKST